VTALNHVARVLAGVMQLVLLASCTPDIGHDAVPEAMEFDTEATPPRVPQPTGLIVNPATGRIDFALAGTELPDDCSRSSALSPAECQFDKYLETLDGFPTLTPASAPATAPLDPSTLTLGSNVMVLPVKAPNATPDVVLGFDDTERALTLQAVPSWALGESYFVAVRAYAHGVRALSGTEVVGSPTQALLKEDSSLTCGATTPEAIDPKCPALALLAQTQPEAAARANAVTLEAIRQSYLASGVWQRLADAGLPKREVAVLWEFPIHTASVAELDPSVGLVPVVSTASELRVAVHGPVDAASVTAFVFRQSFGSVVLSDLTALAASDLTNAFPSIEASYENGAIVMKGGVPFVAGHQYGVFMTNALHAPGGVALVPSPVSVLLALPYPIADTKGKSLISSVADADAVALEAGRAQLAALFNNPIFGSLTGLTRDNLVYCFAFTFEAP
jgi:hypothetical protein